MKYWVGKIYGDTLGHKRKPEYALSSLAKTKKEADGMASFLAGFAGYEVVQVEISEIKPSKSMGLKKKKK